MSERTYTEQEMQLERASIAREAAAECDKRLYAGTRNTDLLKAYQAILAIPTDQSALDRHVAERVSKATELIERERVQWEKDYKSLLDASKHWPDELAEHVREAREDEFRDTVILCTTFSLEETKKLIQLRAKQLRAAASPVSQQAETQEI